MVSIYFLFNISLLKCINNELQRKQQLTKFNDENTVENYNIKTDFYEIDSTSLNFNSNNANDYKTFSIDSARKLFNDSTTSDIKSHSVRNTIRDKSSFYKSILDEIKPDMQNKEKIIKKQKKAKTFEDRTVPSLILFKMIYFCILSIIVLYCIEYFDTSGYVRCINEFLFVTSIVLFGITKFKFYYDSL